MWEQMKIIMIKEYKKWKVNDIIDVNDGFGKNFLIKKHYGIIFNKENEKKLNAKLKHQLREINIHKQKLQELKNMLEKNTLNFYLKISPSTQEVIGTITKKHIVKELKKLHINIPKFTIQHVNIRTLGLTEVIAMLDYGIIAKIKVNVLEEKHV